MKSQSIPIDHTHTNTLIAVIDVTGDDEMHYRYERSDGNAATLTATVQVGYGLSVDDQPFSLATLTIDGTANTLDVSNKAYAYLITDTAQANRRGILHIYTRPRPIQTA